MVDPTSLLHLSLTMTTIFGSQDISICNWDVNIIKCVFNNNQIFTFKDYVFLLVEKIYTIPKF